MTSPKYPPILVVEDAVDRANRYINDVLSGRRIACKQVKQACKRQLNDLKRAESGQIDCRFDRTAANRVCRFIEKLPHVKGVWANRREKIILEDWMCFILTTVYGWLRNSNGLRRFHTVYIEVPRKNAKSTLSAGAGLYALSADREQGAEVYAAATTKDQARIVFNDARMMAIKTPAFLRDLGVEVEKHKINVPKSGSIFRPLSRDQDGNLDGLNAHFSIVDELHGHKDRGVWDVLSTARGARGQPILWGITTAGFNKAGICYEQHRYVEKILDETASDDSYFGIIYTIDKGDDPWAESSWMKANPNYGISVSVESIQQAALLARQVASAQNNFLTKHLNVWVNADTAWMNMKAWQDCVDPDLAEDQFEGEECILAGDLATKTDIAATCKLFWKVNPDDGKRHYYPFFKHFIPERAVIDGRNSQYSGWAAEQRLIVCQGETTDLDAIEDDIKSDAETYRILEAAFDPWQAAQLMQHLLADGMEVVEYRMNVQNLSAPMKELEALVLNKQIHFTDCPILEWMFSNVVCHTDAKENIYPRKEKPENKIDSVVALLIALGRAMLVEEDDFSFLTNPVISK